MMEPNGTRLFYSIAILTAVYFLTGFLGLRLDAVSGFATLVWPPTGIALAAVLLFGSGIWPGIFLGAFFVNLVTGAPILAALAIGVGNTLESLIGAYVLKRVFKFDNSLDKFHNVILFFAVALLSPIIAATIGVSSLWLAHIVSSASFGATWLAWWLGDVMGAFIFTPLILVVWKARDQIREYRTRGIEAAAAATVLLGINIVIFGGVLKGLSEISPITYLLLVPLIWLAIRFGSLGATVGVFFSALISIIGTIKGFGPFMQPSLSESLLFLQAFMAVIAITTLILAASSTERRVAEEQYRKLLERFLGIFNSSGDSIGYFTPDGTPIDVNPAFEKLTGYSKKEILTEKKYQDFTAEEYSESEAEKIREVLATGEAREYEEEYITKDDLRVPVLLTVFTVHENRGRPTGLAVIIKDISVRVQEEKELEAQTREIRKMNKFMIGRELKMVELKKETRELKEKLNER